MDADISAIGRHLKKHRAERGWSLDRVARECGVSKAMLGQIERGESTPTVSTLWKIAGGLRLPLSRFLVAEGSALQRPRSGLRHHDASGMIVTPLFAFDPALGFEMFVIELPRGTLSESASHAIGVIEHLIVLEGEMELRLDGEWQFLSAGEAVRFPADQPHAYRNQSRASARIHDLIHYPFSS
ncbi:helix-turn-helix domain-containing protein [Salinicola halimionae]|uniref:helix-turn-helix domain-containing protein n=1 Tax=Salinicola halimionae TaxID=1949081 RepID=UPI000DA2625E|nr:XRE family transcriptional regulator [Salinicola halimionae]